MYRIETENKFLEKIQVSWLRIWLLDQVSKIFIEKNRLSILIYCYLARKRNNFVNSWNYNMNNKSHDVCSIELPLKSECSKYQTPLLLRCSWRSFTNLRNMWCTQWTVNYVTGKDLEGSGSSGGHFTWKDPSKAINWYLRSLSRWNAPKRSCKDHSGFFQGVSHCDIIDGP